MPSLRATTLSDASCPGSSRQQRLAVERLSARGAVSRAERASSRGRDNRLRHKAFQPARNGRCNIGRPRPRGAYNASQINGSYVRYAHEEVSLREVAKRDIRARRARARAGARAHQRVRREPTNYSLTPVYPSSSRLARRQMSGRTPEPPLTAVLIELP